MNTDLHMCTYIVNLAHGAGDGSSHISYEGTSYSLL